ncbi:unnamed protein product [Owenia fusiformis]|uniref:Uncharacterized protein n=1 Tax=Owenia fusiformis TaxID=6347 RepID=A0A8J1U3G1_OWEFU|nr:unnamed protein product [Owenia fusiformis]
MLAASRGLILLPRAVQCNGWSSFRTSALSNSIILWEKDRKSGYKKDNKKTPKEHIKTGLGMMKDEMKLFGQETVEKFKCEKADMIFGFDQGEFQKVWSFNSQEDIEKWTVTSDGDNNEGKSKCLFSLNENRKGYFHGTIDRTVPKTGINKYAGYCNIKSPRNLRSFQRADTYDWTGFSHLMIRARGDGRTYILNLGVDSFFDITWNNIFQFALFTRGGPYWQTAKIPFSKFFHSAKGRIQDRQQPLTEILHKVTYMSITQLGEPGDFGLEIDFIAAYCDHMHQEKFAYEMYQTDKGVPGS